ncbi:ABC transporter substrate-binding protein [Paenibacillus sp. 32352]|uniref:ABC transporter substrate-binding protein n=1 Tax=Paenibacillus sp. 32352 TaxID=1969111 RepID=UPI0009AE99FE|nr:extracellular solute-binding protein [Paenibacillus sp. 32352]
MKLGRLGLTAGLVLSVMMAGCDSGSLAGTGGEKSSNMVKPLGKDEKASIKVAYYDKNSFLQMYGNMFSVKYPNIDVQVVSMQDTSGPGFQKLIDDEQPDVLVFHSPERFKEWAEQGRLYQLDPVIRQDKFDTENILPNVMDLLKSKGGGNIYGLAPSFYSQALFYNKDLFEKFGVPLPHNKMSWEEVLQLAKRFPKDGHGNDRIYGFARNSADWIVSENKALGYYLMNSIGTTHGLEDMDPVKGTVTLQSEGWKHALGLAADALKSGAVYTGKTSDPADSNEAWLKRDLFVTGKVAMTLESPYMINNIVRAKEELKDVNPVNWDIVTVPVDPKNPDASSTIDVSEIFAINTKSSNPRAAWELVKYINSDEMAKQLAKTEQFGFLSRTAYVKERDGRDLEPFYMLKMSNRGLQAGEQVPSEFYATFNEMAGNEVQLVVDGKKSVDEALNTMQTKGQEIYNTVKQKQ